MADHLNESQRVRSVKPQSRLIARLFGVTVLPLVALALVTHEGWSQQTAQTNQRNYRTQRASTALAPAPAAAPAVDPTSALGQALASCDKDAEQETFALPGLKADVILNRCYKGRAHLICVFNALISEAKSLTNSYTKIVEAKYPEFNTVEKVCHLKREALTSDIASSEDFTKRFAALKSQYESASGCAGNVKQAFREVTLADMTDPPEVLKLPL